MAIDLDNLDDVLKGMAKLETAVTTEVIREARKNILAIMRKSLPTFKANTPIGTTGNMRKSLKLKSRSRRGKTSVRVYWTVSYAGYVNFWQQNKSSGWFASEKFKQLKGQMDREGVDGVRDAFKKVLNEHGVKVVDS